jgi:beta-glucosidase
MKRTIQLMAVAALTFACTAEKASTPPVIPQDAELEQRVEQTLSKMSLDEKVGQMLQLNLDCFGKQGCLGDDFELDEEKLDTLIRIYKVGSVLNAPQSNALKKEKWASIISRIQDKSMEVIGIPCIYGVDQNHGTTYTQDGTMFPQNINMGASFNRELVRQAGAITGYETRASNITWTFCPTLDLTRVQSWPRVWENFGEDSYLNGQMGAAATLGFQGETPNKLGKENIAACLKHYMGYGAATSGKDRTPAHISVSDLKDKHFTPYKTAIEAGALSIMVNSGSVNGLPCHANYEIITEWLKDGLNWDGVVVTDWSDINYLYQREMVAKDKKEAIKMAINAGIDMSMDPYSVDFCVLLKELVNEGEVPMSRIDDAVRRILRMKYRLGLFDCPNTMPADYPKFADKEFAQVATRAAEESMVLLKNEKSLLPFKEGTKILLTGPNANSMRSLNGGWSYSWQGHLAHKYAEQYNTILEAFTAKFGKSNVLYEAGVVYDEANWKVDVMSGMDKAVAKARQADVIVACIGENSYCETPGNINDLTLSRNQIEMVKELAKTGKPIVLVLNIGRPRIIREIEPLADAIINIMLPGNYGADALARLLTGEANFSGKLPYSYPIEPNSLTTYDYKVSEQVATMEGDYNYHAHVFMQWPFGFGLSYTTFEYSNLKCDKETFGADDELTFTVDVKNTGNVAGKEAVLLYSRDLVASVVPDNRRLRAFDKVELQPGETKTVTLKIKAKELSFVDYKGNWLLEDGDFRMMVSNQSVTITKK